MNIFKASFFFILLSSTFSNKLPAQDSVKIFNYLGKKINTVVEYRNVTIDSIGKRNRGMDSLINNNQKVQWETLLKINEKKLIVANRTLKRMQVGYLDQSNYFFDSQNPVKLSGFLSVINEIYNGLTDKDFKEIVPISKQQSKGAGNFINRPNLYNISPYDTANYISNIFLFQNIPKYCNENDKWGDTLITEKSVLLNFFTIRSKSKNNLTLFFKSSMVALNRKHDNQSARDNHTTRINVFENSTITEGFMDVDPNTHLIYSIRAATTRKIESKINESIKRNATIISKFTLYNSIE